MVVVTAYPAIAVSVAYAVARAAAGECAGPHRGPDLEPSGGVTPDRPMPRRFTDLRGIARWYAPGMRSAAAPYQARPISCPISVTPSAVSVKCTTVIPSAWAAGRFEAVSSMKTQSDEDTPILSAASR